MNPVSVQPAVAFQTLDEFFAEVDGYGLAAAGRDREGTYSEDFTYGEITPQVAWDMFHAVNAQPGEVYYDLGCGTGKSVIYGAALFPLGKCIGVELVDELYQSAEQTLTRFQYEMQPMLPADRPQQDVRFIHSNMLDVDISDADIVYIHCTCFNPNLMDGLTAKFEQLQPGSRIIAISKEVESPYLILMDNETVEMGWGTTSVFYYERSEVPAPVREVNREDYIDTSEADAYEVPYEDPYAYAGDEVVEDVGADYADYGATESVEAQSPEESLTWAIDLYMREHADPALQASTPEGMMLSNVHWEDIDAIRNGAFEIQNVVTTGSTAEDPEASFSCTVGHTDIFFTDAAARGIQEYLGQSAPEYGADTWAI